MSFISAFEALCDEAEIFVLGEGLVLVRVGSG
jgi:hypothetical protein